MSAPRWLASDDHRGDERPIEDDLIPGAFDDESYGTEDDL